MSQAASWATREAGAIARAVPERSAAIEISTSVTEAEWTAYVDSHADATVYHQWGWERVFWNAFGHRMDRLVARRAGRIAGVLPLVTMRSWLFGRFMVSLPFVNYGGVLASTAGAGRALVDEAGRLAVERGLRHVELRHRVPQCPHLPSRQHKVAMTLSLPAGPGGEEEMWSALDRKVRNQVRKAEKSGLTVESGGGALVPAFYRVFARNMRDLGTPVYSRRLFDEVLDVFPNQARVFVVRLGGEPVAASVTIRSRDRMEVPWASSLREHSALAPNNLLYWAMIRDAIASGCRLFDFGRSSPGAGTYKFKEQWGARPEPLTWEYVLSPGVEVPNQGPTNPKFSLAIETWKRLPVPVANLVGPSIVRAIP